MYISPLPCLHCSLLSLSVIHMSSYYITTAIDYVNGDPHVGHATEKVLTDVVARYHRSHLGEDTFFLTGTDENSLKNVQASEKAGLSVEEYVEKQTGAFEELGASLNLSFDRFIKTSSEKHFRGAKKFWSAMKEEDLYKKHYKGFYCVGCEEFKLEKELVDEKCPEHDTELEIVEEENWFFRLSAYQEQLQELISSDTLTVVPEYRKNEVLSFIESGLEDFSVSRSVERARNWGVPVPGDESQIMYVWVDALSNYITALGYAEEGEDYKKYWTGEGKRVHVIGKGILRFHAMYWIAMLLSAELPIPTTIYAHEYLTINGKKMSKSLGNVIYPHELVEKYGVDATRYLLLSSLPYTKDGNLSWEKMTEKYNADLANGLGNLASRVVTLAGDLRMQEDGVAIDISHDMEHFMLASALEKIWERIAQANKYIEENKPWELKKTDSEKFEAVMAHLLGELAVIANALEPFLPETAKKINDMLATREKESLFMRL